VWTYTPVAGKFRLDFSALNGADVLGAVGDVGSIQALAIEITGLEISDGGQPNNGVFGVYNPGTMVLSSSFENWDETLVKELYNGKEIYITLKNEATYTDPIFGKNTVYFIGFIDSLSITVDPINLVTNLTITATDVAGAAMNFPVVLRRTDSKATALQLAIADATNAGQISPFIKSTFLLGSLATSWEPIAGQTFSYLTIGEGIDEYIAAEVATIATRYFQDNTGNIYLYFEGETIVANSKAGRLIPDSITTNIVIGQDGANVPTAYNLANSVASYQYGGFADSQLSNPTIYTAQLDVPTASLKTVADQTSLYKPAIQPIEVTINSARSYQPITFDNTLYGYDYFYPSRHYWSGDEVKTTPAFTGGTYYHTILGTTHTITPDNWQTTYQLWKGL
jgi:hypothetical protein